MERSIEKTDFDFPVFNRTNVFHDRLLGVIARQIQMREEIREEIQRSVLHPMEILPGMWRYPFNEIARLARQGIAAPTLRGGVPGTASTA